MAMSIDPTQPDASMMPYHPYRGGDNPDYDSQTLVFFKGDGVYDQTRRNDFLKRVQDWLKSVINTPVILAIAPGHKQNPKPGGFVYDIVVDEFRRRNPQLVEDFITLHRTETVIKSTEGNRSKDKHIATIAVKLPVVPPTLPPQSPPDYNGKVVVILDDVWTTGSTLCACRDVMKSKYPEVSAIKMIAIARTK